jgi:hypothetical protein
MINALNQRRKELKEFAETEVVLIQDVRGGAVGGLGEKKPKEAVNIKGTQVSEQLDKVYSS